MRQPDGVSWLTDRLGRNARRQNQAPTPAGPITFWSRPSEPRYNGMQLWVSPPWTSATRLPARPRLGRAKRGLRLRVARRLGRLRAETPSPPPRLRPQPPVTARSGPVHEWQSFLRQSDLFEWQCGARSCPAPAPARDGPRLPLSGLARLPAFSGADYTYLLVQTIYIQAHSVVQTRHI